MKQRAFSFLIATLAAGFPLSALADYTQGASCSILSAGPIGNGTATDGNNLVCVSGVWQYPFYEARADSATSCVSALTGALRWNGTSLQYCNGSTWTSLSGGGTVNSGTQYQMAYYSATGTAVSGDSNIATDAGNDLLVLKGSVGIGTASPAAKLDVNGGIDINDVNGVSFPPDYATDASIAIGSGALAYQSKGYQFAQANIAIGYQALGSSGLQSVAQANIAIGSEALGNNVNGSQNIAIGKWAAYESGSANNLTAVGYQAAYKNTSGANNTALGFEALNGGSVTFSGSDNTAVGADALWNVQGASSYNVAVGYDALYDNYSSFNTAVGDGALYLNASGNSNTAVGYEANYYSLAPADNVAVGRQAMFGNSTNYFSGFYNTAVGDYALYSIISGANGNTALGYQALYSITSGEDNTAIGYQVASATLQTGYRNILIGAGSAGIAGGADTPASNTDYYLNIGNTLEGSTANANAIGKETLYLNSAANSVNYVQLTGGATGTGPTIAAAGTDSNVNLTLSPQGAGELLVPVGNVGIGTTNPATALDVGNNSSSLDTVAVHNANSAGYSMIDFNDSNNAQQGFIGWGNSSAPTDAGGLIFATNSGPLYFGVGGTNDLTVAASGYVGIGTANPITAMQVRVAPGQDIDFNYNGNGIGISGGPAIMAVNDNNTSSLPLTLQASVYDFLGGNVGIGTTSPSYVLDVLGEARFTGGYTTSDLRWKQNIKSISNGLALVEAMRGVTFDWRRKQYPRMHFSRGRQIGFIAQEVEKILPEVVSTDNEGYKSVAYQAIVPIVVNAVQQLKSMFDSDHSELARLKADNDNLRSLHDADAKAIAELRAEMADLKKAGNR